MPVVLKAGKRSLLVNALLDPCSDASYISEEAAAELGTEGEECVLDLTTVCGQRPENMQKTSVSIEGTDGKFKASLPVLVTKDLTSASEVIEWATLSEKWPHLSDISFPKVSRRQGIDVLIGVSPQTLSLFVPDEARTGEQGEPAAVKTPLGWVAFGPMGQMERIDKRRAYDPS